MCTDTEENLECPFCKGSGSVACQCNCPHCDNEEDCEDCDGTGFNPLLVDLEAWAVAANEFRAQGFTVQYREGSRDSGKLIGLRSSYVHNMKEGTRTLPRYILAKDFLLKNDGDEQNE